MGLEGTTFMDPTHYTAVAEIAPSSHQRCFVQLRGVSDSAVCHFEGLTHGLQEASAICLPSSQSSRIHRQW